MAYTLTPSRIKLLSDCPKCFWLHYNKNLKRPDGIFPSLPSGMDGVLKDYFDTYTKKGELPPEIAHLKGVKLFDDLKLLEKWRTNWIGIMWKDDVGNVLKGAVDAILVKDEKLIVLDYKTRGYPLKANTHTYYIEQLALYNLLLHKNGHETMDYAYLLFYHPIKVHDHGVEFQPDLVKIDIDLRSAEQLFNGAIAVLKGPMPHSSKDCVYCAYRSKSIPTTLADYS